jgi:hypothetical protein
MVEVKSAAWALEKEEFLAKLSQAAVGEGYWPTNIVSYILWLVWAQRYTADVLLAMSYS